MTKPTIRKSPYQPGVYVIGGESWKVPERYTLNNVLGSGSFSEVCSGVDTQNNTPIAVKRISNVLQNYDNAKRVLRELCILRRLDHPNIIKLYDAFVTPSTCGPVRLVKGTIKHTSIDLYLVLELANSGDLFNIKGNLTHSEVKSMTWQILHALQFLHTHNIWHRDIKSANILLHNIDGHPVIKIADLGSARSATSSRTITRGVQSDGEGGSPAQASPRPPHPFSLSRQYTSELPYNPDLVGRGGGGGVLTSAICTPCYRAPEVVMSRGGYTSGMDVWSVGCIMGELLQRIAVVGGNKTNRLQVGPMFQHNGLAQTPKEGEHYLGYTSQEWIRNELEVLFNVIGTPTRSDVADIQRAAWRDYLVGLPRKAPTLFRRFGQYGEVTVDMLAQLLAFNPARRPSADEALWHEYFKEYHILRNKKAQAALLNLRNNNKPIPAELEHILRHHTHNTEHMLQTLFPRISLTLTQRPSNSRGTSPPPCPPPGKCTPMSGSPSHKSGVKLVSVDGVQRRESVLGGGGDVDGSYNGREIGLKRCREVDMVGGEGGERRWDGEGMVGVEGGGGGEGVEHFCDILNPADALYVLEQEMETIHQGRDPQEAMHILRSLIERECKSQHQVLLGNVPLPPKLAANGPTEQNNADLMNDTILRNWYYRDRALDSENEMSLVEDVPREDAHVLGRQRVGIVSGMGAGKSKAKDYSAEMHLDMRRHHEWPESSGQIYNRPAGPTWGVSVLPPNIDHNSSEFQKIVSQQQAK